MLYEIGVFFCADVIEFNFVFESSCLDAKRCSWMGTVGEPEVKDCC